MQSRADEARRLCVAIKQHVFRRDEYIIEDDERIDFVEPVGQRVILGTGVTGKTGPADELQARRAEIANKPHRIIGQLGIALIGDCWFHEGLIGISSGGFIFGAAYDNPGARLLDDMQKHVGVPS